MELGVNFFSFARTQTAPIETNPDPKENKYGCLRTLGILPPQGGPVVKAEELRVDRVRGRLVGEVVGCSKSAKLVFL
jgi:hypothetical protein